MSIARLIRGLEQSDIAITQHAVEPDFGNAFRTNLSREIFIGGVSTIEAACLIKELNARLTKAENENAAVKFRLREIQQLLEG